MADFVDELQDNIPALRRYARALTNNADRADDLVQDCLERAFRRRGLFQPRKPMRHWLFTILVNLHRNHLRTERRRVPVQAMEGTPEPSTPACQVERLVLADLARAAEALPGDQKEALFLVTLEGFTYNEAASILGVPLGTLMSRIGRAREALRHMTDEARVPHLRAVK